MTYDQSCVFCKIAAKKAPSTTIYEDETIMAFLDIRPLYKGHTLVIPKKHYTDIFDISDNELKEIHSITKKIAPAIKKATNADGISIIQQNGKAAGQDIFHMHVHVVPRFEGKKLPHFSELKEVSRAELEKTAEKIKAMI